MMTGVVPLAASLASIQRQSRSRLAQVLPFSRLDKVVGKALQEVTVAGAVGPAVRAPLPVGGHQPLVEPLRVGLHCPQVIVLKVVDNDVPVRFHTFQAEQGLAIQGGQQLAGVPLLHPGPVLPKGQDRRFGDLIVGRKDRQLTVAFGGMRVGGARNSTPTWRLRKRLGYW